MFPLPPEVPAEQRAVAQGWLRYEDVSQDGRLMLPVLPHFAGRAIWQTAVANFPAARAAGQLGIIPILSKFVLEGFPGVTLSVRRPLTVDGRFQLAHTVDEHGEVNRIVLVMWADVSGPKGRMHAPPVPGEEITPVGRVYAEHVFTRLFAPPAQRKVLRLELPGMPDFPPVPPARHLWHPPEAFLGLPPGAEAIDADLLPDAAPTVFGLSHTDSNQHVNSLVYPRLFEDAALRRFAAHGRSARVLAGSDEIGYRKPCFAGDRMKIVLRAYQHGAGGPLGAVGGFVSADDPNARPHCILRMQFAE